MRDSEGGSLTLTLALTLPLALALALAHSHSQCHAHAHAHTVPQSYACVCTLLTAVLQRCRRSHPLRSRASRAAQYLKPCSVAIPSPQWREAPVSSTGRLVCAVLDRSACMPIGRGLFCRASHVDPTPRHLLSRCRRLCERLPSVRRIWSRPLHRVPRWLRSLLICPVRVSEYAHIAPARPRCGT